MTREDSNLDPVRFFNAIRDAAFTSGIFFTTSSSITDDNPNDAVRLVPCYALY